MTPHEAAKAAFDVYCASRDSEELQARLARWQARNFGAPEALLNALGINEEFHEANSAFLRLGEAVGKVTHAVLKNKQRIRGFRDEEKVRAEVADGIADMLIYSMGLGTIFRFDLFTLLRETAEQVMTRDWKQFPKNGVSE